MSGFPPIARADGLELSLHRMKAIAQSAEGRRDLHAARKKAQATRDAYAELSKQQLAELDELLARYASVLDGKAELQA